MTGGTAAVGSQFIPSPKRTLVLASSHHHALQDSELRREPEPLPAGLAETRLPGALAAHLPLYATLAAPRVTSDSREPSHVLELVPLHHTPRMALVIMRGRAALEKRRPAQSSSPGCRRKVLAASRAVA